jgi:dTDP-4-dehydrorhamnose reductase
MNMKKVLILGGTGMLGSMLVKYFDKHPDYEMMYTTRQEKFGGKKSVFFDPLVNMVADLPDADYYINAIGIINKYADTNPADTTAINTIFPRKLAAVTEATDIKTIHITTDCVFDGTIGNYDENSPHTAHDRYGQSKSLGEPNHCMVLRTSIIGPEKHSYVSLLEWVLSQSGQNINGFLNHFWNGVTTLQFAKICDTIMQNDLYEKDKFHVHSPQVVNKFELVSMINDIYNVGAHINPMNAAVGVDRSLSTIKPLCAKLNIPDLRQQIEEMKNF